MVMAQFLLPMFLALLLVVVFRPLHEWFRARCRGRDSIAAGLTTLAIMLIVLLPTLLVLARAATEAVDIVSTTDQEAVRQRILANGGNLLTEIRQWADDLGVELPPDRELVHSVVANLEGLIAPAAWGTTRFLGNFVIGLLIMLVSLYFFLADGPSMIKAAMHLSPLNQRYEEQLLSEFGKVSRAVVLATLLAAMAQGLLAGMGYWVAGLEPLFLLTLLTMLLALVPFVGAMAVWVPACLWLYFYEQRVMAAGLLTAWCVCVVSLVDNLIKPYVLHGQSNLHPLLALLSVLGGAKALGPIGIFVGPMVVAFLQALLIILRTELDSLDHKTSATGS
jgi:predicted PurR-regulated permease PerM